MNVNGFDFPDEGDGVWVYWDMCNGLGRWTGVERSGKHTAVTAADSIRQVKKELGVLISAARQSRVLLMVGKDVSIDLGAKTVDSATLTGNGGFTNADH